MGRHKVRIQNAQHAVLSFLIKNNGGSAKLAKDLGLHVQIFTNWAKRGVSVKHVVKVASHLKVSPYLLNYKMLMGEEFAGKSFRQLIKECSKLTSEQKRVASELDSGFSRRSGSSNSGSGRSSESSK